LLVNWDIGTLDLMKSYGLDCPVARTLDTIGDRWTALILRDLFTSGARRFQDFQESLTGIAPNTLSDRLKALEADDIVTRKPYDEHPPRFEYVLTEKGRTLGSVMKALRDWGIQHARSASTPAVDRGAGREGRKRRQAR
jgi:DNA-binding HxlR family transcriptional regulator